MPYPHRLRGLAVAVATLAPAVLAGSGAAQACGPQTPCAVAGGHYLVASPPGEARGALVFFHGYNASAQSQMRHESLVAVAQARGLAFVAPHGEGRSWAHRGSPHAARPDARDEIAFVAAVLDDLAARFGFGPEAILVGGFSQGASMAYDVACEAGDRIGGMVGIAGVFWEPLRAPGACVAPAPPQVHVHGTADGTFPLEGRAIGRDFRQGDTRASLALMREAGGCAAPAPAAVGDLACEVASCARGESVLCLHPGGHSVEARHLAAALDRLGYGE